MSYRCSALPVIFHASYGPNLLGDESESTFVRDLHKGLYFNYIMANPPLNLKGWYDENSKNSHWPDYPAPPESNANYAWIMHILSHLKPMNGVAGFLLANGALGDSDTLEIRRKLIENDKVEAIIILPRELFITTDISVTLWILNQNKKGGKYHERMLRDRSNEILFIDLRTWTENPVKGESKKKVRLSDEQIQRAADIYHTWQNEGTDGTAYKMPELYQSVNTTDIKNQNWSLVPSKYIEFIDHDLEIDFHAEMKRIQAEMPAVASGEDLSKYKIVRKDHFACNLMHVGRDVVVPVALHTDEMSLIVSPAYVVFGISSERILPQYLLIWLSRTETDRYAWFMCDNNIRGGMEKKRFFEMDIPVPSISEQTALVELYEVLSLRRSINEKLKAQIKDICPILIRGSLENGG